MADADVLYYINHRKEKRNGENERRFTTFTASTFTEGGNEGKDFSIPTGESGALNASSFTPVVSNVVVPPVIRGNLVQGEWIDESAQKSLQVSQLIAATSNIKLSDLETLKDSDFDKRSLDVKIQLEDTKKAFHTTRIGSEVPNVVSSTVWGKVDREVTKLTPEEEEKKRQLVAEHHKSSAPPPKIAWGAQQPSSSFETSPGPNSYLKNVGSNTSEQGRVPLALKRGTGGPRLSDAPPPVVPNVASTTRPTNVYVPPLGRNPSLTAPPKLSDPPILTAPPKHTNPPSVISATVQLNSDGLKTVANPWRPSNRNI
jgi:hypothetical protein